MKAAAFEYVRPADLGEALRLLAEAGDDARVLAGGQSLGPMLNLRLARPGLLVDIRRLPELWAVEQAPDALIVGAAVTHAAIEDGRIPDVGGTVAVLPAVAARIAYRAVRNRGTIGGSLAHADPAADWVTALMALGATAEIVGAAGASRSVALDEFMLGAFRTALGLGEILRAVRIPRLSAAARWGWYKVCRKPGEFAMAIGAVLIDPARNVRRTVMGATGGRPIVLYGGAAAEPPERHEASEPIEGRIRHVALRRAFAIANGAAAR